MRHRMKRMGLVSNLFRKKKGKIVKKKIRQKL